MYRPQEQNLIYSITIKKRIKPHLAELREILTCGNISTLVYFQRFIKTKPPHPQICKYLGPKDEIFLEL